MLDGVRTDSRSMTVELPGEGMFEDVSVSGWSSEGGNLGCYPSDGSDRTELLIIAGATPGGEIRLRVFGNDDDVMVISEPKRIVFGPDGTVMLTITDYIQLGAAMQHIPGKLGEFEARIAALEAAVSLIGAPVPDEVPTSTGTSSDPYAPGLGLCGEKE